jgi:hypothetical protein
VIEGSRLILPASNKITPTAINNNETECFSFRVNSHEGLYHRRDRSPVPQRVYLSPPRLPPPAAGTELAAVSWPAGNR